MAKVLELLDSMDEVAKRAEDIYHEMMEHALTIENLLIKQQSTEIWRKVDSWQMQVQDGQESGPHPI